MSDRFRDDVNALLNAEPFVPFQVVLTSGTTYQVISPYQLVLGEAKATFYFSRSTRVGVFRMSQIVTLETLEV